VNICPSLVEIRSETSQFRRRKERKKKPHQLKYKPFGIAMPCWLIKQWH